MNKIFLIIQREYLARVRKRSFIVMSILGPILFAAFLIVPTYLATMQDKEIKKHCSCRQFDDISQQPS